MEVLTHPFLVGVYIVIGFLVSLSAVVSLDTRAKESAKRKAAASMSTDTPETNTPLGTNPYASGEYEAIIGYKQAWLVANYAEPFTGVSGFKPYGVVGEKKDAKEGFYAFTDLENAKEHHQTGNVFLEVLQSDTVNLFELGQVSTNQRVLQVLIGDCSAPECTNQAESWTPGIESEQYHLWFYCGDHTPATGKTFSELTNLLTLNSPAPVVVAPLRSTANYSKWIPTVVDSHAAEPKKGETDD